MSAMKWKKWGELERVYRKKKEKKKKSMNGNVIRWAKGQDGGQGRPFCNFSISFINSDSTAA